MALIVLARYFDEFHRGSPKARVLNQNKVRTVSDYQWVGLGE